MSDTQFNDFDPEDAYDVEDDPEMRLQVLEKVVADLRSRRLDNRFDGRKQDALRVITNFLNERSGPDNKGRLETLKAELEAL